MPAFALAFPLAFALPIASRVELTVGRRPDRATVGKPSRSPPAPAPARCRRGWRARGRPRRRGDPRRPPRLIVEVRVARPPRRRVPGDGGAAGEAAPLGLPRSPGNQVPREPPGRPPAAPAPAARPLPPRSARRPGQASARGPGRPGWRRRPVARRVAARPLLDRPLVARGARGRRRRRPSPGHRARRRARSGLRPWRPPASRRGAARPGVRRLPPRPLLERRADRERAREAVRLLVRERARGGLGLRVATVAMVRSVRTLVPLVLERHERAGRRSIGAGQPSLGHRGDDTRGAGPRSAVHADPLRV